MHIYLIQHIIIHHRGYPYPYPLPKNTIARKSSHVPPRAHARHPFHPRIPELVHASFLTQLELQLIPKPSLLPDPLLQHRVTGSSGSEGGGLHADG